MCAKRFDQRNPETLISMMNLALIWKDMGRHEGAIGLMQACFDIRQEVLGPDYPDTVSTLSSLRAWRMEGG